MLVRSESRFIRCSSLAAMIALTSCSDDSHAAARAPDPGDSMRQQLGREADFFEFDGALGPNAPDAKVRMFYAFQPADSEPDRKPLLLFFQGGPIAGMVTLWAGNTGAQTLDPVRTGSAKIAQNPSSWTKFANLLYVDSPYAGFSYIRDAPAAAGPFDAYNESASFLRALVAFIDRHPALAKVPVVLVGESYGGLRATLMLQEALHFEALRTGDFYRDEELARDLERYLHAALGDSALTPSQIGAHFAQVLIQPFVNGSQKSSANFPATPEAQALVEDASARALAMAKRLLDPDVFRALTGVVIEDMHAMYASARSPGLLWEARRSHLESADERAFARLFGELAPDVFYYTSYNSKIDPNQIAQQGGADAVFADVLRNVRTFITNSSNDSIIDAEDVADLILHRLGAQGTREALSARVDQLTLRFPDGVQRKVRFPRYDQSGHPVALYEPELFAEDVRAWLDSQD